MKRTLIGVTAVLGLALLVLWAARKGRREAYTDPKKAGRDFLVQGEYVSPPGTQEKLGAQVIALGSGRFTLVFLPGGLPGEGWDGRTKVRADALTREGRTTFAGGGWEGTIGDGQLRGRTGDGKEFSLARLERRSPTLGRKPPQGAVVLFDGSGTDEWRGGKLVEGNLLDNGVISKREFGDFILHLEFRLPFMPRARGQGRANSGVYLQDRYEVQVLDSFGLEGRDNECGGIYAQQAPRVNLCYPPLAWQTYDIDFRAARFEEGRKVSDAEVTVKHNGVVIHDRLRLKSPTAGGRKESPAPGPIRLQDHGDPVHYRNIWIVPK